MKIRSKLIAVAALVLMASLGRADLSYAQVQAPGAGPLGQGAPGWDQGRGPGNPNCPNYPGYRNCRQGGGYGRD